MNSRWDRKLSSNNEESLWLNEVGGTGSVQEIHTTSNSRYSVAIYLCIHFVGNKRVTIASECSVRQYKVNKFPKELLERKISLVFYHKDKNRRK